ncbi:MAG: hypothetical protein ACYCPS_05250, partial [Candidatus Saccharimonadales bacterium]
QNGIILNPSPHCDARLQPTSPAPCQDVRVACVITYNTVVLDPLLDVLKCCTNCHDSRFLPVLRELASNARVSLGCTFIEMKRLADKGILRLPNDFLAMIIGVSSDNASAGRSTARVRVLAQSSALKLFPGFEVNDLGNEFREQVRMMLEAQWLPETQKLPNPLRIVITRPGHAMTCELRGYCGRISIHPRRLLLWGRLRNNSGCVL